MVQSLTKKRNELRKFFKDEGLFNTRQRELYLQLGKRKDKTYFNALKKLLNDTVDLYLANLSNRKGTLYLRMSKLVISELKILSKKF